MADPVAMPMAAVAQIEAAFVSPTTCPLLLSTEIEPPPRNPTPSEKTSARPSLSRRPTAGFRTGRQDSEPGTVSTASGADMVTENRKPQSKQCSVMRIHRSTSQSVAG